MTAADDLLTDAAWVRGGRSHDVVHAITCTRKGRKWVVWNYANFKDGEEVDFIIRGHPWLRWCSYCKPEDVA